MRTFQFSDAKSHKFWNIEMSGTGFTVTYGKVGSAGMTQTASTLPAAITLTHSQYCRIEYCELSNLGLHAIELAPGTTYTLISHNHIHDTFYSGISVGSVQDFGPCEATGNVVEYNHIHDVGQGMLSDLAGIYACSTPKTRVAFNVVHDVARRDYGGWGIYPDEGAHDLLIRQNLVYRCRDGALFAHHSRESAVRAFGPR